MQTATPNVKVLQIDRYSKQQLDLANQGSRHPHKMVGLHYSVTMRSYEVFVLLVGCGFLVDLLHASDVCVDAYGEEWVGYGTKCYFVSSDKKTWDNARTACQLQHGDLAKIEAQDENEFLKAMTLPAGRVWMGLTETSGNWNWLDDTGLPEEPLVGIIISANTGGHCAVTEAYDWHTGDCSTEELYLCEAPQEPVPSVLPPAEIVKCFGSKHHEKICDTKAAWPIRRLTVERQHTTKPCKAGKTYFIHEDTKIRVTKGCRARFLVEY
ncbi:hypothetical protein ScPMuIL_008338 [Solemya velum]